MTNFNAYTLTAMIQFAEENGVEVPKAAFCGRHPLAVRKQYVIDAVRKANVRSAGA